MSARHIQIGVFGLIVITVGFFLLYPIFSLLITSFETNEFGRPLAYGVKNWDIIFGQIKLLDALWNTVSLSATRTALSIVLGVALAWLIARTNLPGRQWLEVGFWIALFMPALPVTLGWVFLLENRSGLLNVWLMKLPFVSEPLFNIYSWWGIVWVHMMGATLAIKVFLLVPAFRGMDSSLEEAGRTSGANVWIVLKRIVVPMMAPTILVVLLLGVIKAMQAFEIELILGTPARIEVYSTVIYRAMSQEPPNHGMASALSIAFLLMIVPLVVAQQWYSRRHEHASISGKFRNRTQDLGRWRWPIFAIVLALLTLMTIVPFIFLLISTFMKMFGLFAMDQPWTDAHWIRALTRGDMMRALWNSLRLGVTASVSGMIIFAGIAYLVARTKLPGRRILDFLTWMPALVPGVVLSLGLLQLFTGVAFLRPFYGTMGVLVVAILIGAVTVGTQLISGALRQIGAELEEAAWAAGGSRFYTFRRVVLPLIAPTVAVIGLEIFASANSAVAIISLLGTGATQPLSILQLVLIDSGRFEAGAVAGIIIMILTIGSAFLARYIATKAGLAAAN